MENVNEAAGKYAILRKVDLSITENKKLSGKNSAAMR